MQKTEDEIRKRKLSEKKRNLVKFYEKEKIV
jgi:hypothetical protein